MEEIKRPLNSERGMCLSQSQYVHLVLFGCFCFQANAHMHAEDKHVFKKEKPRAIDKDNATPHHAGRHL